MLRWNRNYSFVLSMIRITVFCTLLLAIGLSAKAQTMPVAVKKVSDKYACGSCHVLDKRMVGPSWRELAKKGYSARKMAKLIRKPKPSNWPNFPPMAPIETISDAEVKLVAEWLDKLK